MLAIFDNLMDVKTLAGYLSVSVWTIYAWVSQRKIPYIKVGHSVMFYKEQIDEWLKERMVHEQNFDK